MLSPSSPIATSFTVNSAQPSPASVRHSHAASVAVSSLPSLSAAAQAATLRNQRPPLHTRHQSLLSMQHSHTTDQFPSLPLSQQHRSLSASLPALATLDGLDDSMIAGWSVQRKEQVAERVASLARLEATRRVYAEFLDRAQLLVQRTALLKSTPPPPPPSPTRRQSLIRSRSIGSPAPPGWHCVGVLF